MTQEVSRWPLTEGARFNPKLIRVAFVVDKVEM